MPAKKPGVKEPPAPPEPPWQVILEEIRSQNRATIEALQGVETRLDTRIDEGLAKVTARLDVIEAVVRHNSAGIREITAKADNLAGLEKRLAGLERRTG